MSLPAGEGFAILPYDRVVPLRHPADEVLALSQPCDTLHFLIGGVRLPYADIVCYGRVEKNYVLKDDRKVPQQSLGVYPGNILTSDEDIASIHVPEAGSQLGACALSPTRWSYKCRHFTLPSGEGDILEHLLSFLVGEGDMVEFYVVIRKVTLLTTPLHRHRLNLTHTVQPHIEKGEQGEIVADLLHRIVDHCRSEEEGQVDEERHCPGRQEPSPYKEDGRHAKLQEDSGRIDSRRGAQLHID